MTSLLDKIEQSDQIIRTAIKTWKPTAIISLFSGGYDSLTTTHLVHALGIQPTVYAINTRISADGWYYLGPRNQEFRHAYAHLGVVK